MKNVSFILEKTKWTFWPTLYYKPWVPTYQWDMKAILIAYNQLFFNGIEWEILRCVTYKKGKCSVTVLFQMLTCAHFCQVMA